MRRYISSGLIGLLLVCILTAQKQEAVSQGPDGIRTAGQKSGVGRLANQAECHASRLAARGSGRRARAAGWRTRGQAGSRGAAEGGVEGKWFPGISTSRTRPQHKLARPSPPAAAIKATGPSRAVNEPVADGAAPAASPKTAADDEYLIGAGDVVQVSVWGEQSASVPSAVVRPDGKIPMPLLKEIAISGLTPTQAGRSIADQLDQYIKGANVTVVVSQINSKKTYLLGAVKKEGTISYTYRMTVMQALSEAGGLTDYAKRKIYVMPIGGKKKGNAGRS